MRRRYAIAVSVLFIGATVWLVIPTSPAEPMYQGKALRYWLRGYRTGNFTWNESTEAKADEAVGKIGTNAIPTLLRMLSASDSALDHKLLRWSYRWRGWAQKAPFLNVARGPRLHSYDVIDALRAFQTLGSKSVAVPGLTRLLDEDIPALNVGAIELILGEIGPEAAPAVPALLRKLRNGNSNVRGNALSALGGIRPEPALVVPEITKSLDDQDPYVRVSAARALMAYGNDAKSSVPALIEKIRLWTGQPVPSQTSLRFGEDPLAAAKSALMTIDPAAATKADVQ